MMPMMPWTMPMAVMTIVDRLNGRLNFRLCHIHHRRGRCSASSDKQADT
jgi:hypothetical protein